MHKLFICADDAHLGDAQTQLQFFGYKNVITFYPRDSKLYQIIPTSTRVKYQRIKALNQIQKLRSKPLQDADGAIIVTTLKAIAQKIAGLNQILFNQINLSKGDEISMNNVATQLVSLGFARSNTALEFGEYAIRGSILDVMCNPDYGYRIDFFGNQIESIHKYAPSTQRKFEENSSVESINILPNNEFILDKKRVETFIENFIKLPNAHKDTLYESIKSGITHPAVENYLPYFYNESLDTILQYIPKNTAVFIDFENFKSYKKDFRKIYDQYEKRKHYSIQNTAPPPLHPSELQLEPENLQELINDLESKQNNIKILSYSEFMQPNAIKNASKGHNFYQHAMLAKQEYLELFKNQILNQNGTFKNIKKYVVCCNTESAIQLAVEILKRADIFPKIINEAIDMEVTGDKNNIFITKYPIETGFKANQILFISELELFGKHLTQKQKRKAGYKNALNYLSEIKCGELIIHKEHGIGRFDEIKEMEIGGRVHDFIALTYANDDKLFLPVENIELISKYSEGDIHAKVLDKLGAVSWQRRKSKLKSRIKMQAAELIATAAARLSKPGIVFEADHNLYQQFVEGFKFMETADQMNAIQDVLSNLNSGTPMDRLVCGDVGYGKTEVALRAACAVACSGQNKAQVMVVVPTTLLARQHYKIFSKRFENLNVRVGQLSRFTKRTEINQIYDDLQNGKIDIIIGTHALLSDNVKLNNLGLIIIDEEQHFGVKQKEKLKKLKKDVHILTLSATPIPRTLHMSLNNVKTLSLITTPPTERIPVQNFVMPFDEITIRDAIMREKLRGGRTFIVTPRVQYIGQLIGEIERLFENSEIETDVDAQIKIASAHGKLTTLQLDKVMNDFYDGKYDALISTSIIESGLDIPTANTIIIDRAHMFGLAQLYQIRGRVGRSNINAYAYFTYPKQTMLSENANKRLSIIQSLEDFGGGFHIASHDMEIRGYGNLLGEEQSGHIREVGMELYQDMLSEAIAEIRDSNGEDKTADNDWSPRLNLGIAIQIPKSYISDSNLKLSFYRRIANIQNIEERDDLYSEMVDRFGPLPADASHLFEIVELKQLCKQLNIERLDSNSSKISIKFKDNKPNNPQKVIELINKNPNSTSLKNDMSIGVNIQIPRDPSAKISFLLTYLVALR